MAVTVECMKISMVDFVIYVSYMTRVGNIYNLNSYTCKLNEFSTSTKFWLAV